MVCLVIFCLFDEEFDSVGWKAMATRLASLPNQRNSVPGKTLLLVNSMIDNPELGSFVGPFSWMPFNVLHANGIW